MSNQAMIVGLTAADVRFVVIGGVAAILHGSARNTNDLDVCYDPAPENLERLARLLGRWHAYLRGVEPGRLPWSPNARSLRVSPVLTLLCDEGLLDVMHGVQGIGEWKDVLEASVPTTWDGLAFRIISLDALIASKRAAGRKKDHDALLELEALRELRHKRGLP